MPATRSTKTEATQADQAYQAIKQAILRGDFPEGSFLSEPDVTKRFHIGRTPFREACNRLHNESILDLVPRRGFRVPEMTFLTARDLLETRLILEGAAAELAAVRAEPSQLTELNRLWRQTVSHARSKSSVEQLIESNMEFHLQLARMSHNRELERLLRGVLERALKLSYLAFRWSSAIEKDTQDLLHTIVEAVRRRDPSAAHKAVVEDITRGQLNILGRELWSAPATRLAVHTRS